MKDIDYIDDMNDGDKWLGTEYFVYQIKYDMDIMDNHQTGESCALWFDNKIILSIFLHHRPAR